MMGLVSSLMDFSDKLMTDSSVSATELLAESCIPSIARMESSCRAKYAAISFLCAKRHTNGCLIFSITHSCKLSLNGSAKTSVNLLLSFSFSSAESKAKHSFFNASANGIASKLGLRLLISRMLIASKCMVRLTDCRNAS